MLTFDTREIEAFIRSLERFEEEVPDIAAGELIRQIREFAESGVNPDGSKWPALTAVYKKWKLAHGGQPVANKRLTGAFLASVKMRDFFISVDSAHAKIAEGLEKKRISFDVAPMSAGNVERLLLKRFYA